MNAWINRAKAKLDTLADNAGVLSDAERALVLHAASFVDRLSEIEQMDAIIDGDHPNARLMFFNTACDLRRALAAIEAAA